MSKEMRSLTSSTLRTQKHSSSLHILTKTIRKLAAPLCPNHSRLSRKEYAVAVALISWSDRELPFNRIYEHFNVASSPKFTYTFRAKFQMPVCHSYEWPQCRIEKLRSGNLKTPEIKVSGSDLYLKTRRYSTVSSGLLAV